MRLHSFSALWFLPKALSVVVATPANAHEPCTLLEATAADGRGAVLKPTVGPVGTRGLAPGFMEACAEGGAVDPVATASFFPM